MHGCCPHVRDARMHVLWARQQPQRTGIRTCVAVLCLGNPYVRVLSDAPSDDCMPRALCPRPHSVRCNGGLFDHGLCFGLLCDHLLQILQGFLLQARADLANTYLRTYAPGYVRPYLTTITTLYFMAFRGRDRADLGKAGSGMWPGMATDCTPSAPPSTYVRASPATCDLSTFRLAQSAITCARSTRQTGCYCGIVNARATLRTSSSPRGANDRRQPFRYVRTYVLVCSPRATRLLPPVQQLNTYVRTFAYAQHWYVCTSVCYVITARFKPTPGGGPTVGTYVCT